MEAVLTEYLRLWLMFSVLLLSIVALVLSLLATYVLVRIIRESK